MIVRLRDAVLQDVYDLHEALGNSNPSDEIHVTVQREGRAEVLRVKLGKRPEE